MTRREFRSRSSARENNQASRLKARLQAGFVLHQQGNLDEARKAYEEVLKEEKDNFDALHLRGVIFLQSGDYARAVELISDAIKINPNVVDAYINLGNALKQLNRLEAAVVSYDKAIELKPNNAEAYNSRGNTLSDLKRHEEALDSYNKAIELRPNYAEAHNNRGIALSDLKRGERALDSYNKAIDLMPDYAEAYNNRGQFLDELKRHEEALASYNEAIELKPNYAEAYYNRGITLNVLKRHEEALASYDKVIELKPDYAEAHNNRGNALNDLKRHEEALASFNKAIELKSDYAEAYTNGANTLNDLKRNHEALTCFNKAIELKPEHAEAFWNKAITELLLGIMGSGWIGYEYRKIRKETKGDRQFVKPLWLGEENIDNKSIFIHWEQGFGDTIQFCRYLKLLTGIKVFFAPQRPLLRLMEGLSSNVKLVEVDDNSVEFDYHCPLLSLPLAFKTTLDNIPSEPAYLFAEPDRIAHWQKKLGNHGFLIGINWQGSKNEIDKGRSFPLSLFNSLSNLPELRLISLHKGEGIDQLENLPVEMRIETLGPEFDAGPDAFLDTAAVMKCCDLVISSDTATAHLAGALGVAVWVPLKFVPDWRWLLDREDSPWYPSMKLFRQKTDGDWQHVFKEIEGELLKLMASSLKKADKEANTKSALLITPMVPVSWGELIDKITILEIKNTRLSSENALANVSKELELLRLKASPALGNNQQVTELKQHLKVVNEALWEIEDMIREKEGASEFDAEFIQLARSVYIKNDERAAVKRGINLLLNSELIEEKGYAPYKAE